MEIRDPVHGSIHIQNEEIPIIKDNFFQRLRGIKQLGFAEYVFPGATHTRLIHSIGVMHIGEKAFDKLFKNFGPSLDLHRLKETFKLACLLHDVGHAPLSHSTESVMPNLKSLKIPSEFLAEKDLKKDRQATHEDYTIKSIADSSFAKSFKNIEQKFGVSRKFTADLIRGSTNDPDYFVLGGVNYFPLLHQLVSSELDCDRMDYLLRDSYFCGVSYGSYDLDWLLDNLETCIIDGQAYLGINERAVVTFDDFLLSRYHMFIMVYFHYRAVCLEQLLLNFFKTSPDEYQIPSNIEEYLKHDDHYLMKILKASDNKYAQAIIKNEIPSKIYESFKDSQHKKLFEIESFLKENNLEYILCASSGRLSKYYTQENQSLHKFPLKVARRIFGHKQPFYSDIGDATELFQKFSHSHAVNRLHCDLEQVDDKIKKELYGLIQK